MTGFFTENAERAGLELTKDTIDLGIMVRFQWKNPDFLLRNPDFNGRILISY